MHRRLRAAVGEDVSHKTPIDLDVADPISFFLRPEVAQFVCASHERGHAARMPGTDPVVERANAILKRLATTATAELQKYRSGRSVLLDELRNAAKKLDPSTHPDAAKALQGLLLEVAAFN